MDPAGQALRFHFQAVGGALVHSGFLHQQRPLVSWFGSFYIVLGEGEVRRQPLNMNLAIHWLVSSSMWWDLNIKQAKTGWKGDLAGSQEQVGLGLAITIPAVMMSQADSVRYDRLKFTHHPEKRKAVFPDQWLLTPARFVMFSQGLSILKVGLVSTSFLKKFCKGWWVSQM